VRGLAAVDRAVGASLRGIAIGCLTALFVLLFVNVAARSLRFAGFAWFDEIVQGLFAWMVFVGAAALWREGLHFRVDWIDGLVRGGRGGAAFGTALALLSLVFPLAMTVYGWDLTVRSRALTPILDLPTGLFYAAIPLSGAVMTAYSLRDLALAARHLTAPEKDMP
jgi:TRAP-type C4-dicarboxylate transport system permease small subunit